MAYGLHFAVFRRFQQAPMHVQNGSLPCVPGRDRRRAYAETRCRTRRAQGTGCRNPRRVVFGGLEIRNEVRLYAILLCAVLAPFAHAQIEPKPVTPISILKAPCVRLRVLSRTWRAFTTRFRNLRLGIRGCLLGRYDQYKTGLRPVSAVRGGRIARERRTIGWETEPGVGSGGDCESGYRARLERARAQPLHARAMGVRA